MSSKDSFNDVSISGNGFSFGGGLIQMLTNTPGISTVAAHQNDKIEDVSGIKINVIVGLVMFL